MAYWFTYQRRGIVIQMTYVETKCEIHHVSATKVIELYWLLGEAKIGYCNILQNMNSYTSLPQQISQHYICTVIMKSLWPVPVETIVGHTAWPCPCLLLPPHHTHQHSHLTLLSLDVVTVSLWFNLFHGWFSGHILRVYNAHQRVTNSFPRPRSSKATIVIWG